LLSVFQQTETWEGPIKKLVSPLGDKVILSNKKLIEGVAKGESCSDFYPIVCEDMNNPTASSCSQVGLIACNKNTNECPAFFQTSASKSDDVTSGVCVFIIALAILICCLIGLVTILQKMLLGVSTRIIYKATNINGYLAMCIGCGITVLVQSSSITTSALVPLVGMGVLQLEQVYPITLGANVGTTVTAIMASMVSDKVESLQVALAHLFFNITGIVIWYPVPFMRQVPMGLARRLGRATRIWRGFPIVYIIVVFFLVPLILLGISTLFEQKTKGFNVLGSFLVILLVLVIFYFVYWWKWKNGRERCTLCMSNRQARRTAWLNLPDDMAYLKKKVNQLVEHTGLPEDDEDEEEGDLETPKKLDDSEPTEEEEEVLGNEIKTSDDSEYVETSEYGEDAAPQDA
jgi:sodium-dependent phosphate cotransporter